MSYTDKKKRRLFNDLKNKDYRREYVSSSIDVGVASQIRALREQRNWNQTKLAEEANMHQVRISTLENPSHSPTLETLKKLAVAFDVALMVRFIPFSDLVKWKLDLSSDFLNVMSFDDDLYFKKDVQNTDITADKIQYTEESIQDASDKLVNIRDNITPQIVRSTGIIEINEAFG